VDVWGVRVCGGGVEGCGGRGAVGEPVPGSVPGHVWAFGMLFHNE